MLGLTLLLDFLERTLPTECLESALRGGEERVELGLVDLLRFLTF